MSTYDRGDLVRLTATFTVSGVPTDPAAISLHLRNTDGTLSILTYGVDVALVRASAGVYRYDFSAVAAGQVSYRWVGTPPAQAAEQGTLFIQDSVGV